MADFLDSDGDNEEFEGFVVSAEEKASYKAWSRKRRASEALDDSSDDEDDLSDDDDDDDDGDSESDREEVEEDVANEVLNEELDDDFLDDSTDGEASPYPNERCPVCLMSLKGQMLGTPNNCPHVFCFECIQEWSKNATTCPVGRKPFSEILVHATKKGPILQRIPVEERQAEDDINEVDDPTYCEICNMCDREDRLLLCDGCDNGYHMECLTPAVEYVPIEEWFCPSCAPQETVQQEPKQEGASETPQESPARGRPRGRAAGRDAVAERTGATSRARTVASTRGRGRARRGIRRSAGGARAPIRGRRRGVSRSSARGRKVSSSTGRKAKRKKRSGSRKRIRRTGGKRGKRSSKKSAIKSTRKRLKVEEDEVSPFVYEPRRRGRTVHARLRESLKSATPSFEPGPSSSLGKVPFPNRLEPSTSFSLFGNIYALHDFEEEEEYTSHQPDYQTEESNSAWSCETANPDVLGSIFEDLDTLHSASCKVARDGRVSIATVSCDTRSSANVKVKNNSEGLASCKDKPDLQQEDEGVKYAETAHGSKESSLLEECFNNRKQPFPKLPSSSESTDDETIGAKNRFEKMKSTKSAEARTAAKINLADAHLPQTSGDLLSTGSGCYEPAQNHIREPEQLLLTSSRSTLSTKERNCSSVLKRHKDAGSCSSNPRSAKSQLSNFKIPKRNLSESDNDSSKIFEERSSAPGFISKFKIPKRTQVAPVTGHAPSRAMSVLTSQQASGNHSEDGLQSSSSHCGNAKSLLAKMSSTSKGNVHGNVSAQGDIAGNERSTANILKVIKQETLTRTEPVSSSGCRNGVSSPSMASHVPEHHRTSSFNVAWIKQEKLMEDASINSSSTATSVVNSGHTVRGHSKKIGKDVDSGAFTNGGVTKIKQDSHDGSSDRTRAVSATRAIAAKQSGICAKVCSNSYTPKLIKQETLTETSPVRYSGNGVTISGNASSSNASVAFIKKEKIPQSISLVTGSTRKPPATSGVTDESHAKRFSEVSGIHENISVGLRKIKQEYAPRSNSSTANSATREVSATSAMVSSNVTGNVTKLRELSVSKATSSASVTGLKHYNMPKCSSANLNSTTNVMSAARRMKSLSLPGNHLKRLSNIPENHASSSNCVTLLPKVSPLIDQLKPLKGKEQRVSNLEIIEMLRQRKRSMTKLVSRKKGCETIVSNRTHGNVQEASVDFDRFSTSCRGVALPVAVVKPSPHVQTFPTGISGLTTSGHPSGSPVKSIARGIIDFHSCNAREFRRAWTESDLHGSKFAPGDLKIKHEVKLEKQEDTKPLVEIKDNRDLQRRQGIARLQRNAQIVDEVKHALKPYFIHGEITKDNYKLIMKRCVEKIKESQSSVHRDRVGRLVRRYIKKIKGHDFSNSP